MNVTSKIAVDLTRANIGARVNAVQGDGNTRSVEITLLADGNPWTPPGGVEAAIAYRQPSGTKGLYNLLADGAPAISISGNVATVTLAPQMLTVPGTVQASIVFNDASLNRLTTFPFSVSVASNPAIAAQKTEDYIRLQWLEDKLDEYLKKYEGLTDDAIVRRIVDEYLTANPPEVTETDPTVPAWAKQPTKPTYTASEVGALPDTYTPPIATETTLGGVKAAAATEDMTQPVGITADGQLVTAPSPDSGGNVDQSGGLTSAQISALDGMFKIASFTADPTAAYAAFKTAFGITDSGEEEPDEPVIPPDEPDEPEVTLTSISATYSGGDVTAGTAVDDLTGIVVTAHYSDGTSETVTGYTLSGTIAEGSNTITVSYGGMTTTFTVTGTSAGTTDDYAVHNYSDYSWTNGGILRNNTFQEFSNYSYSEYIPCEVGVCYETNAVFYQPIAGMYDENDNHLGDISSRGIMFISNNNAKKLRLNALTSDIPSAYFARYVHDPASSEYVFPEYKWTLGSYVNASGQIVSLSSYSYSEYIPVESGREILLCTNAVNFSIAFYDANKEFTRTVNAGSESTEVSINVASDEQYFVLNSSTHACGSKAFYWKYAE